MFINTLLNFIYKPSGVCEQHDLYYLFMDKQNNNPYKYALPGTLKMFKNSVDRTPIKIINSKKQCQ